MRTESSSPKTTRPVAKKQREIASEKSNARSIGRKMDAFPDKIDIRDWFYHPTLRSLPPQLINCDLVPTILDQGVEGACTGFAMAAVINYHLVVNGCCDKGALPKAGASPRMLYEMARRYDEWPGENYEGSSARGTMKGWMAHGVTTKLSWPDSLHGHSNFDEAKAKEALNMPAGAYYRVMHRNIRDMHAALNESGILYTTLMVHKGWDDPGAGKSPDEKRNYVTCHYQLGEENKSIRLPVINRIGRASDGHAVAIVGYTKEGFIIQNSWGRSWGTKGFAILPYEDWMLHASDCWVAQLGVPVITNLWEISKTADTDAGKQRASQVIPLEQIRPYVINIGNNGRLSDSGNYWTTKEDIKRLFSSINEVSTTWKKKRIILYLHGGLNSETEVARRIVAFKQVCLDNEIYPVHIMWETDFWTSLKDDVFDIFSKDDKAGGSWLNKLREGTIEILDRTMELTAALPGSLLWNEMKENAALASATQGTSPEERAMNIIASEAAKVFKDVDGAHRKEWELHIVGHSAGSIFAAHAINALMSIPIQIKSIQFMAPAMTVNLFKTLIMPHVLDKLNPLPLPVLYIMSDLGERDDNVAAYGKSLLYLVSNSFEKRRQTPLMGMEKYVNGKNKAHADTVDADIAKLYRTKTGEVTNLVISGEVIPDGKKVRPDISRSESHGGFDNDVYTMNAILYRIMSGQPKRPFEVRDLQF